jgi:hypothetical protein
MRIGVVDQHGAVRCKFVSTHDFLLSLRNGIDFSHADLGEVTKWEHNEYFEFF